MICPECNKEITPRYEDDSFDYAGTHCTGGLSGTFKSFHYECPECETKLDYAESEAELDYERPEPFWEV